MQYLHAKGCYKSMVQLVGEAAFKLEPKRWRGTAGRERLQHLLVILYLYWNIFLLRVLDFFIYLFFSFLFVFCSIVGGSTLMKKKGEIRKVVDEIGPW